MSDREILIQFFKAGINHIDETRMKIRQNCPNLFPSKQHTIKDILLMQFKVK